MSSIVIERADSTLDHSMQPISIMINRNVRFVLIVGCIQWCQGGSLCFLAGTLRFSATESRFARCLVASLNPIGLYAAWRLAPWFHCIQQKRARRSWHLPVAAGSARCNVAASITVRQQRSSVHVMREGAPFALELCLKCSFAVSPASCAQKGKAVHEHQLQQRQQQMVLCFGEWCVLCRLDARCRSGAHFPNANRVSEVSACRCSCALRPFF